MMKTLLLTLVMVVVSAVKFDYTGHMLIRVTPTNEVQLNLLRSMQDSSVDFWHPPSCIGKNVEFRVAPESYTDMAATLNAYGLPHQITVSDFGKLIQEEEQTITLRRALKADKAFDFESYHTYQEIMNFVDQLIMERPNLITKQTIGTTLEGRAIVMATISPDNNPNKTILFFDCGMHAREWISPATCIWIMNELVGKYGSDPNITSYLNNFVWKFIPVSNPDGYSYTWTNERLWRKNRASSNSSCYGVDLNRNFGVGFGGGEGSSGDPCSNIYRGPGAFSELETRAIRDILASYRGRVKAAVSVHSYDQQWLSPNGCNSTLPSDYSEMERVMNASVSALTATYGTVYEYGDFATLLYTACGVTIDHYYQVEGIVHSYTVELRDLGEYAFELPPEFILPTATETWNGLKAMTDEILKTQ